MRHHSVWSFSLLPVVTQYDSELDVIQHVSSLQTHLPWPAVAEVEDDEELALGPALGPTSGGLRLPLGPGGPMPCPAGCGMPGEVGAMRLPPAGYGRPPGPGPGPGPRPAGVDGP